MSRNIDKDSAEFVAVVGPFGAGYVQEQHADGRGHYGGTSDARPPETGIAGLWLVFYAAIIGIAIYQYGGAGTAVHIAAAALN